MGNVLEIESNKYKRKVENYRLNNIMQRYKHQNTFITDVQFVPKHYNRNKKDSIQYLIPFSLNLRNRQSNCSNECQHFERKRSNTISNLCRKNSSIFFNNGQNRTKDSNSYNFLKRNLSCNFKKENVQQQNKNSRNVCSSNHKSNCHKQHEIKIRNTSQNCCEAIVDTSCNSKYNSYSCEDWCNESCSESDCCCECMVPIKCCNCCVPTCECCLCSKNECDEQNSQMNDLSSDTACCESSIDPEYGNCKSSYQCTCRCPQFYKPAPYTLNSTYRIDYYQKRIPGFRRYKECDNLRLPLC